MSEKQFRFQELEIWKRGAAVSSSLFQMAEALEQRKYYRFAEQLRAATLSITNNIAEGSGSVSDAEFAQFLNIARRSIFEVANMLLLLSREGYLPGQEITRIINELEEQSRMLLAFRRRLKS
jgi:four helix bundle protein